jgi:sugar phosphate isomerase/epimerase
MRAKVGIQLWTLRREIETDPRGTLKRIAEIGFAGVETAFFSGEFSLEKAAPLLREFGLPVCSAHCRIPVGEQKKAFLEMAAAFRCERMVWHGWPMDPRYESRAGTEELAAIYIEANRFAKSHGLKFGLHNHWWEFEKQKDGHYPYQVLLESLEPDIFLEVDTYWAKAAGQDPAQLVGQLAKRVPLMHIKDGPGDKESPMVAIGTGVQDVKGIVSASQDHVEWLIVEFDTCATDIFAALKESYRYLTQNGLGEGRA